MASDTFVVARLARSALGLLLRTRGAALRSVASGLAAPVRFRRALRTRPLDDSVIALARPARASLTLSDSVVVIRLAEALLGLAPGTRTCLDRAALRAVVLARCGHRPTFVLGARVNDSHAPRHAWVEVDGAPVLERDVDAFRVLTRIQP